MGWACHAGWYSATYYRKSFEVNGNLTQKKLYVLADESAMIYLDGATTGWSVPNANLGATIGPIASLSDGWHTIAVSVSNFSTSGSCGGSVAKFKNSRAESVAIILLRWLTNKIAAPDVLVQRPSIDLCGSCA